MKVSFIIAGVQKGGTTALHRFLKQHDRLFLPDKKELHFFDDERVDWSRPDYDRLYHCHFADAGSTRIWGEATPIYCYWPPSLPRIHAYNRDVKIIISLRDPRERAYSHWRMETARGNETLPFSAAIREGRSRVVREGEFRGYHRVFSYLERGAYTKQLRRVFDLFPEENVFLLDQRILMTAHEEVLDKICDFLKIDRFVEHPPAETVFSHHAEAIPRINSDDRAYLEEFYREELRTLSVNYGLTFR